ncbi:MAG: hypothetical protein ACI84K_000153 [Pseudohongiellaceae bacterium]
MSKVPTSGVNEEVLDGVLGRVKIGDINLYRPLSLLKLKKNTLSPHTEAFIEQRLKFTANGINVASSTDKSHASE